ncbi:TPA: DUF262 domain-containing protein [Campylobacter coli]|nr:DUF262 domain-containing protein [Campylobacter coli]HED6603893.1 DUF262 domain-containing protein [Campylobacter coli]
MIINEDKKIEDLIKEAFAEKIWLPEFQRPFVWDNNQIRLLIDSLFHNYTISSILSWRGRNELARRRVGGSIKDIKIPDGQNENDEITYLLDGQQRTTALTYAFTDKEIFKGNNKTKSKPINLYWDSAYEGDEAEERWIFDDEIIYAEGTEQHYKLMDLEHNNQLINKFGIRFIKLKHVFLNQQQLEQALYLPNDDSKYRILYEYTQKLNILKEKILNRKVVDIEQKGDLNAVLEVFERINTKNTKLSIFDIMVAKTYKKYNEGYFDLRSFFKMITSNLKSIDNNYFKNLEKIEDLREQKNFDEGTILYLIMIIINQKFKAKEVLKITTDEFINNIKRLHFILKRLTEIMEKDFYIDIEEQNKYQPIAKFVTAFLAKFSEKETDVKYRDFLKKWYWNTIIFNRYPGSQNERIERDFKRVVENENSLDNALLLMKADNSRSFEYIKQQNSISNIFNCYYNKKSEQIYKTMIVLFKSKQPRDFYSGIIPSKDGTKKILLEEHHIFPINSNIGKEISKNFISSNDNIINNIANIALITKESNNKINNKNPSTYIEELLNKKIQDNQQEQFFKDLETHFITKDMVEYLLNDDFENFIISRTALIYDYMKNIT